MGVAVRDKMGHLVTSTGKVGWFFITRALCNMHTEQSATKKTAPAKKMDFLEVPPNVNNFEAMIKIYEKN